MRHIQQLVIVLLTCGIFTLAQIIIRECPENCQDCNEESECQRCLPGFFLKHQKICEWCPYGFRNCPKGIDVYNWQCKRGYVKKMTQNNQLQCTDCPANCVTCENTTYCISCEEEFYKAKVSAGHSLCLNCPPGCKNCYKVVDKGSVACDICKEGFNKTQGECRECPSNCKSCQKEWCDTCKKGFYKGEQECDECPPGCRECKNSTVCLTCEDTYYLNPESQECEDCPSNCRICNSKEVCDECQEGFVLQEDKQCYECPLNCKRCNKARECLSCEDGFFIEENDICRDLCYRCGSEKEPRAECGADASNTTYNEERCPIGNCWVKRTQDGDDVTFFRGCSETMCSQDFLSEKCESINENKTICSKCCWGPRCNSFTLRGVDSAITMTTSPILLLTSGLLCLLLGSAS